MSTAIAWALIHSLWQGALMALLLLSVRIATRSARIRYVAGVAALVCTFTAFGTTLFLLLPEEAVASNSLRSAVTTRLVFSPVESVAVVTDPNRFEAFTPYLASFWLVGVCLSHLWQLAGLVSVRRLKRRGTSPVPEDWVNRLAELRDRLRVSRPVTLLESVIVNTPVVIGHMRPVILVPAGLLANLPADQIEAVLLHELAHVRRCDYLVNILQRWIEALFFYHPAVWWMSHVVRAERENCCDDVVIGVSGDRHGYAQALAALETSRFGESHLALAASSGSLAQRIRRILESNAESGGRAAISSLTLIAAVAMFALGGWQHSQAQSMAPAREDSSPYRKWVEEDVVYIINDAERAAYERLTTDDERQMFIEQFWERRGTLPDGRSPIREEHYRRIAHANEFFAESVPGWKTDRGRLYITLGPPTEIQVQLGAQDGRSRHEIWRYRSATGADGWRSFTLADLQNNGEYRLQAPWSTVKPAAVNRMMRWTVIDPRNRYVTGLAREHFAVRVDGSSKPLDYFEGPDAATAIAVCSAVDLRELADVPVPGVVQTRTMDEAVRHVSSQQATRKVVIHAGCYVGRDGAILPAGIFLANADAATARVMVIEVANQYLGGYRSDSREGTPEVIIPKQPDHLPPLRVRWTGQMGF